MYTTDRVGSDRIQKRVTRGQLCSQHHSLLLTDGVSVGRELTAQLVSAFVISRLDYKVK